MKFVWVAGLCICMFSAVCLAVEEAEQAAPWEHVAYQWFMVNQRIVNNTIEKTEARRSMKEMRPLLDRYFFAHNGVASRKNRWVFPLEGYGPKCIDTYYRVHGFDFLSPVRHPDHPAYDLFIHDRNQDSTDDLTGKPVKILSLSAGVVISRTTGWIPGSDMRGGNCVWIYDPYTKGLFYYAHMRDVLAYIGDIVQPGDPIGTVGRTGSSAWKRRSPTHLHLMYLKYPDHGYPHPRRFYSDLVQCRVVKTTAPALVPEARPVMMKIPLRSLPALPPSAVTDEY